MAEYSIVWTIGWPHNTESIDNLLHIVSPTEEIGNWVMRYLLTTARLTSLLTIGFRTSSGFRYHHGRRFGGTLVGSSLSATTTTSSPSSDDSPTASDEADLLRWERMYAEGMSSAAIRHGLGSIIDEEIPATANSNSNDYSEYKERIRSKVHVVTYDLDNTLWNTAATISRANDALASHIDDQYRQHRDVDDPQQTVPNVTRVEQRMKVLHQAHPDRYGPMVPSLGQSSNGGGGPVRLTDLRKDAIRSVLVEEAGYNANNNKDDDDDDDDRALELAVDKAFGVWAEARHACIPSHFAASGVVECLQALRQSPDIVAIGAITDGNANPLAIAALRDYFDFCINAEQVGVAKPDRRVYQKAVQHVLENHPWLRDKVSIWSDGGGSGDNSLGDVDAVGPWWVHVGDDFVKDVVAAKDLGMRTIWSRELIADQLRSGPKSRPSDRTRNVETFVQEISKMETIQMEIGADDYLLESLQKEFADAIVDRLSEVALTISKWQLEAADQPIKQIKDSDDAEESGKAELVDDKGAVVIGSSESTADVMAHPEKSKEPGEEAREFKFCIFCGTKLPAIAKFCSSCGGKQG